MCKLYCIDFIAAITVLFVATRSDLIELNSSSRPCCVVRNTYNPKTSAL